MVVAIRNKNTGRLVTGTDYRYHPHHQICDENKPPLLFVINNEWQIKHLEGEWLNRQIGNDYDLVDIEIIIHTEHAYDRKQIEKRCKKHRKEVEEEWKTQGE